MLADSSLAFAVQRTARQLRDKWRNVASPVTHAERRMREFIVVTPTAHCASFSSSTEASTESCRDAAAAQQAPNSSHVPICGVNGKPMRLRNRLPRDAALKAATRDDFYSQGTPHTCTLHIKENDAEARLVHVYTATRTKQAAPETAKFSRRSGVWVPTVRKLRTEEYFQQ